MQLKERKRNKLERFEDSAKDIEEGNWRVLSELSYYR
jgi:hypothetical protein